MKIIAFEVRTSGNATPVGTHVVGPELTEADAREAARQQAVSTFAGLSQGAAGSAVPAKSVWVQRVETETSVILACKAGVDLTV